MNRKHIRTHILALSITILGYILCRFVLFATHGMKDIPDYLALFTALTVSVSFLLGGKLIPIITALAYPLCFAIAYIFQRNGFDPGGGRTNNLWSIWVITYIICFLTSLCLEAVCSNKKT